MRALLLLLTMGILPPVFAADEPPATEAPAEATEAAEADGPNEAAGPAGEDEAIAAEIRAAEEAAANAAPAASNEPFVPTVQISEDLSVSFPVDI